MKLFGIENDSYHLKYPTKKHKMTNKKKHCSKS